MGFVTPGIVKVTGKVEDLIIYKRRDIDRFIIRHKGTLSKEKIQNHPGFEPTRKINREFGGRSRFTRQILRSMLKMKGLSDYNMAGPLNALLKPLQEMDTTSEVGKRSLELSRNPGLLVGFPLNRRNVFETVVRSPVKFSISKEEMKAGIETPALIPGVSFFPVDQYPVFRWEACLAGVGDLNFNEQEQKYISEKDGNKSIQYNSKNFQGEWCMSNEGTAPSVITISGLKESENASLFLVIGIAFGTIRAGGPMPVKYAGCGKIVDCV